MLIRPGSWQPVLCLGSLTKAPPNSPVSKSILRESGCTAVPFPFQESARALVIHSTDSLSLLHPTPTINPAHCSRPLYLHRHYQEHIHIGTRLRATPDQTAPSFSSSSASTSPSFNMVWPFSSNKPADAAASSSTAQSSFEAVAPAPADATVAQNPTSDSPTDYLRSHTFVQPSSPSPSASGSSPEYVPNAASLLGDSSLNLGALSPLAGLGKDELEYLDLTDGAPSSMEGARTAVPSRGWSDDLCYGTGTTYLSGLAIGGLLGAREGFFRPLGVDNPTFRLRLNAVLNQVTRRGSFFGNSAGVVALIYNLVDASIDGVRGKHDIAGAVTAGAISGALFKCTAGVRPMAVASGIMMAAAATWTTAKQALL
ncbi:hypothetical protein PaG_05668 [Moesziomyces aphidis]|uniref:Mitochondrial import inner membrane translocase subunit tim23 n=1 Tax=Moesziomyces aphidis TaxID=84754 RepID=W3VEQ1_MOEAP|nr:hypothetical protein PaG_05668 [Moesziomyces aphidis]